MDAYLFAALGLLAVGMIVWQAWRERAVERRRIPADWQASIERMGREQSQGHHRKVRESALQACLRLARYPKKSTLAPHVRVRLAALLSRDPAPGLTVGAGAGQLAKPCSRHDESSQSN